MPREKFFCQCILGVLGVFGIIENPAGLAPTPSRLVPCSTPTPMVLRHRLRRGTYPLAQERTLPQGVRVLLMLGALLLALYLIWSLFARMFSGFGLERAGATVGVEEKGIVSVTIEGEKQRAENGMLVLPGESVHAGASAHASLRFFDGTVLRTEESTDLAIRESGRGSAASRISLELSAGSLWITTPPGTETGSAVRTVDAGDLSFTVPGGTEAVVSGTAIAVFTTEGPGVAVAFDGESFTISEGQQWTVPASGSIGEDVYETRAPLDLIASTSAFVAESRRRMRGQGSAGSVRSAEILTVNVPKNGSVAATGLVTVDGTVGAGVTAVLVNGQPTLLDPQKGTFTQQIAVPEGATTFDLTITALDASRNVLADTRRSVTIPAAAPLEAPTITIPAKSGDTYRTQQVELILRGGAPRGAVGIVVNEYRLQLFTPTKGEWSYVASIALKNMAPGSNVYEVYAIDAAGRKSPSARLTIIQGGEGAEGVVSSAAPTSVSSAGEPSTNAPLLPGTLAVVAPTAGTSHTATGTGFLLEGTTSAQTASIWVNDYQLQLYRPGKTSWNYIVDVALNNLRKGKNVYAITARNAAGEVLDRMTYVVEFTP